MLFADDGEMFMSCVYPPFTSPACSSDTLVRSLGTSRRTSARTSSASESSDLTKSSVSPLSAFPQDFSTARPTRVFQVPLETDPNLRSNILHLQISFDSRSRTCRSRSDYFDLSTRPSSESSSRLLHRQRMSYRHPQHFLPRQPLPSQVKQHQYRRLWKVWTHHPSLPPRYSPHLFLRPSHLHIHRTPSPHHNHPWRPYLLRQACPKTTSTPFCSRSSPRWPRSRLLRRPVRWRPSVKSKSASLARARRNLECLRRRRARRLGLGKSSPVNWLFRRLVADVAVLLSSLLLQQGQLEATSQGPERTAEAQEDAQQGPQRPEGWKHWRRVAAEGHDQRDDERQLCSDRQPATDSA